jgi:hypothetical protein
VLDIATRDPSPSGEITQQKPLAALRIFQISLMPERIARRRGCEYTGSAPSPPPQLIAVHVAFVWWRAACAV